MLGRIICHRVYNHLDSEGLLYKKKYGFQRNNSTGHTILQLTQDITGSPNKGEYTLGIDGTASKWFKSYLSNIKQYISSQEVS